MSSKRVFPFDKVPKGADVILYGAGFQGLEYYEQNEKFDWCNIIACIDKNYNNISNFPIDVISIENIPDKYEFIVIAVVSDELKESIIENLIKYGVDRNKIIAKTEQWFYKDNSDNIKELPGTLDEGIKIAYCISRALGDQVISLKCYQKIIELEKSCTIDVYCGNSYTAESIYYKQKNLGKVFHQEEPNNVNDYDLIISVQFSLVIYGVCTPKIKKYDALFMAINEIRKMQEKYSPDTGTLAFNSRILLDRARFFGYNRYTMMGCGEAFQINDTEVKVNINEEAKQRYQELNLGEKYITYNYGAGKVHDYDKRQTKEWPIENHENLNKLIKEEFPGLKIVQLGGKKSIRVNGADEYIFGEDLDVVKYILKNSIIHIDCESGLPHLASQLGTKCCVLFGPTQKWLLGYKNNINIVSEVCSECKGLLKDWYTKCIKYDEPICMRSISAERVFDNIVDYISKEL